MAGSQIKAAMITLGCPKNQVDSETLAGTLNHWGVSLVGEPKSANVILINTCGFVEDAKKESIDAILEAAQLKKTDPNKKIIAWGCLTERYRGEIEKEFPEIDGFFGVEPFQELVRFLNKDETKISGPAARKRVLSTPSHTAYLKIADGCDHQCTFCAIPLFKGGLHSRSLKSLIDETEQLVQNGVKEITLVAQDTTAYGSDLSDGTSLAGLLVSLTAVKSLEWIRIMYGHPAHLTDEVIELMGSEDKICPYLDIPLQHISAEMLKRMGRGTPPKKIHTLIEKMRRQIPNLALRTTFIVGFPGETDAMFQELAEFVQSIKFERMGVFSFSPEEGTEACRLQPCVPAEIAEERFHQLMEIQQQISTANNRVLEGKTVPVLVDGYDEAQKLFFGRTPWDALEIDQTVWIQDKISVGEILPVYIDGSSAYDLMGSIATH